MLKFQLKTLRSLKQESVTVVMLMWFLGYFLVETPNLSTNYKQVAEAAVCIKIGVLKDFAVFTGNQLCFGSRLLSIRVDEVQFYIIFEILLTAFKERGAEAATRGVL